MFRPVGIIKRGLVLSPLLLLWVASAWAADWPSWRGPNQNGHSSEENLVSAWTAEGENLIWKADFIGRSTPIVLDGRVYVIGRVGEGLTEQERVAAFDGESGDLVWEHRFNVFHSTIPFNRLGWMSLAGDPQTGNIYAHSTSGQFVCFDRDGEVVWSRSLTEEFGRISGYGGRLHTPVVDGQLVIISFLNNSWGPQGPTRHRYYAFDKESGQVVWISTPGGPPKDTTYSTPVIAEINGRRLLVAGNADGSVYAIKVHTGEKVWGFKLSKRGLNASVVVEDNRVYISHGEENLDNTEMGRVVCIDGSGSGDITQTHEVWRWDGHMVGYTSPLLADNRLYVVDNSANLYSLDAGSGQVYWSYSLGTVGKGSPVWADGKLFATEVNGGFHIIEPKIDGAQALHTEKIQVGGERLAEIYGSPAVAYGRVYFTTEEGLYCLGDPSAPFDPTPGPRAQPAQKADKGAEPAAVRLVPAEVLLQPGQKQKFEVRLYDASGRFIKKTKKNIKWSLEGIQGKAKGETLKLDKKAGAHAGVATVEVNGLEAAARVRVVPPLAWSEDFEGFGAESPPFPVHWIGATNKFKVIDRDGGKVLVKPPAKRGLHRSNVYMGPPTMSGYTIQADLLGSKNKRRRPDMGLVANRYTLDMIGNHQRLQIRSWASDLRMAKTMDFAWEPEVWYTMKLQVDVEADKAVIRGKVWPRDQTEPEAWTITAEDPLPNRMGSPALYGYSPVEVYYDNIKVWKSE